MFSAANAASIDFIPTKTTVHQKEQFAIDIMLRPKNGESINALEGTISFPKEMMSPVSIIDGASIVSVWIDPPAIIGNTVSFSGIIPGGFEGVIDPFQENALSVKKPGRVLRIIFEPKKEGIALFTPSLFQAYLNDGNGTQLTPETNPLYITTDATTEAYTFVVEDKTPPENFDIYLQQDSTVFDGKYFIVFSARDSESGIDHYEIMEGDRTWEKGTSPFLLKYQPPQGILKVKAVDRSDNERISLYDTKIPEAPRKNTTSYAIAFTLLFLVFLFLFFKKKKKREQ